MSVAEAAARLGEAWTNGEALAPFPEGLAPADRAGGEAVAAALVEALGLPVCGVRLVARPGRPSLSAPMLEPRLLRAGTPVSLAAMRHPVLSAGVLGVLAEPLGDEAPVFASLHPLLDFADSRFDAVPKEDGAMVADLAGLGVMLLGKRALGALPERVEARVGPGGARPRPIQEALGTLMAEAASEARRWGGLPAGAALAVVGLGGRIVPEAGQRYAAAVAGIGRINVLVE